MHELTQGGQESGLLPHGRSGDEIILLRTVEYQQEMDDVAA
jgi:hypothetical protein